MLTVLLAPDVTVVEPCTAGRPVAIRVDLKRPTARATKLAPLVWHRLSILGEGAAYHQEHSQSVVLNFAHISEHDLTSSSASCWVSPAPPPSLVIAQPGEYVGTLSLEYWPGVERSKIFGAAAPAGGWRGRFVESVRETWGDLKARLWGEEIVTYSCTFEVPVSIRVVPSTQPADPSSRDGDS